VFSWTRAGLLNIEQWRNGHLGRDVLLLRASRLVADQELRRLQKLLAGEQKEAQPEIPLPPAA